MAIKLVVDPVATADPTTLPGTGGAIHVDFTTTEANECFVLVTRYVLAESSVYRFAAGGSHADKDPKCATLSHFVEQPTGEVTYSSDELVIERGEDASNEEALDIAVQVTGMRIDGSMMKQSRDANARIELLPAGLQQMFEASGLGKRKWAEQLSKSLGKGKNKLSADLIVDALNGKKASENTNRILGRLISKT